MSSSHSVVMVITSSSSFTLMIFLSSDTEYFPWFFPLLRFKVKKTARKMMQATRAAARAKVTGRSRVKSEEEEEEEEEVELNILISSSSFRKVRCRPALSL